MYISPMTPEGHPAMNIKITVFCGVTQWGLVEGTNAWEESSLAILTLLPYQTTWRHIASLMYCNERAAHVHMPLPTLPVILEPIYASFIKTPTY